MHTCLKKIVKKLLNAADIGTEPVMEIIREGLADPRQRAGAGPRRLDPTVEHRMEPLRTGQVRDMMRHNPISRPREFHGVVLMRTDDQRSGDRKDTMPLPPRHPLGLVQEERTRAWNPWPWAILGKVHILGVGQRAAKREQVGRLAVPLIPKKLKGCSPARELRQMLRDVDDGERGPLISRQFAERVPKQVPAEVGRPRGDQTSSHFLLKTTWSTECMPGPTSRSVTAMLA